MEITQKTYEKIINGFEKLKKYNAGALRNESGNLVEEITSFIWKEVSKMYPHINAQIFKGSKKPIIAKSKKTGKFKIKSSVDKHCFINETLVLAIEDKTYLDKCYLERASQDFLYIKSVCKEVECIVLSIENGIGNESCNFFLEEGGVDKIFYFANGKRNSREEKRIYNCPERISIELIQEFVRYVIGIFEKWK